MYTSNNLPYVRVNGPNHPGFRNLITEEVTFSDGSRASIDATEAAVRADLVTLMIQQDTVEGNYRPEEKDLEHRRRIYLASL